MTNAASGLVSVAQVVTETKVPKSTVIYAIATGRLKARKLPGLTGAYVMDPADVTAWLQQRAAS